MHDDFNIEAKQAIAVGNCVVASVTGDTMDYLSGVEVDSHQGPTDGNPEAAMIRVCFHWDFPTAIVRQEEKCGVV